VRTVTFRWLSEDEIVDLANPVLKAHGWAQLNVNPDKPTCRVMGAFNDSGGLVEVLVLQLHPVIGPLVRCDNEHRDAGQTTRKLIQLMEEYLIQTKARGWLVVADSPLTERMCEQHRMKRIQSPVFLDTPDLAKTIH